MGSRRKLYPMSHHPCVIVCCLYISWSDALASSLVVTWRVTVWCKTIFAFARWNHNHRNRCFPSTSLMVESTISSSGAFVARNCSLAVFISSLVFLLANSPVVSSPLPASHCVYSSVRSTRLLYPCTLKYLHDSVAHRAARGVIVNHGNHQEVAETACMKNKLIARAHNNFLFCLIQPKESKQHQS